MPTIERVRVEDIHPYVDEYGNEYLSRDYSTKENQEYVAELARSMAAKGEPDEPVTLVRDGGIWRIVAGNSRVRAMRLLGTRECDAVVLDEDSAKAAVETCVRTNVKKKYSGVEESRFVQQLALFGGDEYVAENACIPVEKAAKVRRAMKIVDDAAEDMTLDHLAAIVDFEDDSEAVAELEAAPEDKWERVYKDLLWEREMRCKRDEMSAALEHAGLNVVSEEAAKSLEYAGFLSFGNRGSALEAAQRRSATSATVSRYGDAYLYRPESESSEEDDGERAGAQRGPDALRPAASRADEARLAWLADAVTRWSDASLEPLKAFVRAWALDEEQYDISIFEGTAAAPALESFDPSVYDAACWAGSRRKIGRMLDSVVTGAVTGYQAERLLEWAGDCGALMTAGYAPTAEEHALCERIERVCEGVDEDD